MKKISNCCSADVNRYDICEHCKEHCDAIETEGEEEDTAYEDARSDLQAEFNRNNKK